MANPEDVAKRDQQLEDAVPMSSRSCTAYHGFVARFIFVLKVRCCSPDGG